MRITEGILNKLEEGTENTIKNYEEDIKNTTGVDVSNMYCEDINHDVFVPVAFKAISDATGYEYSHEGEYCEDGTWKYLYPSNKNLLDEDLQEFLRKGTEALKKESEKWGKFVEFELYEPWKDTDYDDYEDHGISISIGVYNTTYTEDYIEACISSDF